MANWQTIETTKYTGSTGGYDQGLKSTLQYDAESITPTSMTVRFSTTVSNKMNDGYWILWDPGTANEQLFKAKPPKESPTTSHSITLTKAYDDETYSIPKYWICHCGSVTPHGVGEVGYKNHLINYKQSNEQTVYSYFTSSRQYFKTEKAAHNYNVSEVSNAVASAGSSPTATLTDKGNNTCVVSGSLGKNGTNNKISSATLYYTTDNSDPSDSSTRRSVSLSAVSGGSYSTTIPVTKACTAKVYVKCKFEHNTTSTSNSKAVLYYAAPGAPGIPVISYNKSRLTNKENWKVTWSIATAGNANSPIKGYRFRIYKKAAGATKFTTIPIYSTSGALLSDDMGTASGVIDHRYYYDVAAISMTIAPLKHGIVPGDIIKIGLYAYTKNGAGEQLFTSAQTFSTEHLVQNAGIVNLKVNNSWVEGQVYVKANGVWEEADTVNIKVNGAWEESQ